jgi:hypothetical protein
MSSPGVFGAGTGGRRKSERLTNERGESPSRTGHFDASYELKTPRLLSPLHQKCINFIGKTAEVGSIVKSHNGEHIYYWGRHCGNFHDVQINVLAACQLSSIPGDYVVDCSCGHDRSVYCNYFTLKYQNIF